MLHLAVAIQKLWADRADFWPLRVFQHHIQPVFLDDLDVIIQKQQVVAVGRFGGAVVEDRPVERVRNSDHAVGVFGHPGFPSGVGVRNVVDDDDFVVRVGGLFPQCGDAGFDIAVRRAGRDNDRHLARTLQGPLQPPGAGDRRSQHASGHALPLHHAFQGGFFLRRIVQRGGCALAKQLRDVMHGACLLDATQHQIVFAIRPQAGGRHGRFRQHGRCRHPGPANVVCRIQQIRREIRFEKAFILLADRVKSQLIPVDQASGWIPCGRDRHLQQRVRPDLITWQQQPDQDPPPLIPVSNRLCPGRIVGSDDGKPVRQMRHRVVNDHLHRSGRIPVPGQHQHRPVFIALQTKCLERRAQPLNID